MGSWRERSPVDFTCEKQPATGSRGMVVTNHPLASLAGAELLAAGGNAIDAAIGALFTLTVVEPMSVGLFGGGLSHLRLPDGRHLVLDGLSTAPGLTRPDIYETVSDVYPDYMQTVGRRNALGATAVGVPGNLLAWSEALRRFGRLPLADVIKPAIHRAEEGFRVTPYLADALPEAAADLVLDDEMSRLYLPGGVPLKAGDWLVQTDYARTLRQIASEGPDTLYGGSLGAAVAEDIGRRGGWLSLDDLVGYRVVEREVIRGHYRGFEILGPPPPASAGVHIAQMLNILEGFDVAGMGFGSAETLHLLAEVLKIAFADRAASTGDPAFFDVPVDRLIAKEYAAERRAAFDPARARTWSAGVSAPQSAHTTHVTVADREGHVVAATHTINSLFGARIMVRGTGMIANNYMSNFDPHPGKVLSVAPGKRVPTSMAPMMVLRDGQPRYALGLPGGLRIFPSAFQAIINLLDHGMSLQEAVEAPRLWTQGQDVEVEAEFTASALQSLERLGHRIALLPHVGGGMNAIEINSDRTMTGAACWRADGFAIGVGGGNARANARFWPDRVPPEAHIKRGG
ncbi:MAG TPA: gamma-glutamyltransferase [Stellaceae bacterium]|nr:gamma-glutamyltransferase [Stellaceae bacterium]